MSQKNRKPKLGHRPKGLPKTGGRKKGSRNKGNVRLRDLFAEKGFDFVEQVMETINKIDAPVVRMEALLKLAPFFMQRLRQEEESVSGALGSLQPPPDEEEISTADLLKLAGK